MVEQKESTGYLSPREQEIVHLWTYGGQTLADIGEPYGITRERVRQILKKAGALHRPTPNLEEDMLISLRDSARMVGLSTSILMSAIRVGELQSIRSHRHHHGTIWIHSQDLKEWHHKFVIDSTIKKRMTLSDKLDSLIDKNSESPHWIYVGSTSRGFGIIRWDNKREYAHRAAYTAWVGEIPNKYAVVQTCGVRLCCNPAHLITKPRREVGFYDWHMSGKAKAHYQNRSAHS